MKDHPSEASYQYWGRGKSSRPSGPSRRIETFKQILGRNNPQLGTSNTDLTSSCDMGLHSAMQICEKISPIMASPSQQGILSLVLKAHVSNSMVISTIFRSR